MKNIYIVRHGETDWNIEHKVMGQADIPLNEKGREQAKQLRDKLSSFKFDICFTSPLKRALETAEIVCNNQCEIICDDLLKERSIGDLTGRNKAEIDWEKIPEYGGETRSEIFERAEKFLEKIQSSDYENILIVSHNGLLKNLRHLLENREGEIDYGDTLNLENCAYCHYKI